MDLRADRVHMRVPAWLTTNLSGPISLAGPLSKPTLRGDLLVHRAVYNTNWDWKSRILTFGRSGQANRIFRSDEEHVLLDLRLRTEGASFS